jgi:proteasome lid subunit RPN8/RPN11
MGPVLLTHSIVILTISLSQVGTSASEPHAALLAKGCYSLSSAFPTKRGPVCSHAVDTAIKAAFAMAASGMSHKEFGFAVVATSDGSFYTTKVTGGEDGIWRASVPVGVVAIFHTHRTGVSPRPSADDVEEADRLQLPYYVISNTGLWVYEPDSRRKGKGRTYQALRRLTL